ncbi:MAG: hypothetical protein KF724_07325 [Phycisphaeraceae bacterium]|nr:hypothetical protein [Phycisphaeraceae bacterium]
MNRVTHRRSLSARAMAGIFLGATLAVNGAGWALDRTESNDGASITALRGISERVEAPRARFGALRAKPNQPLDAPIVVRVVDGPGDTQFIEFVGTVPGEFELIDRLERIDGRAIEPSASLRVKVESVLFGATDSDLRGESAAVPIVRGGVVVLIVGLVAVWLILPLLALLQRRPSVAEPLAAPPAPPTVAEEIAAIASRAREATLSVDEQGRLELLLLRFWRERLRPATPVGTDAGLAGAAHSDCTTATAEAVRALRTHPESGALIRAIEAWLHQHPDRSSESAARAAQELERFIRSTRPEAVMSAHREGSAS